MVSDLLWSAPNLPELIAQQTLGLKESLTRGGPAPSMAYGRHRGPAPPDARRAAVLALLYQVEGVWHVPLTRRQPHLSAHAGQICLPGGAAEQNETLDATALRETHEELGVSPQDVTVLVALPEIYLFNSNFLVTPWLGAARRRPKFRANPAEVAELIELPIAKIGDVDAMGTLEIRRGKLVFEAPTIEYEGHQIWGATRLMLADLARRIPTSRR